MGLYDWRWSDLCSDTQGSASAGGFYIMYLQLTHDVLKSFQFLQLNLTIWTKIFTFTKLVTDFVGKLRK